MSIKREEFYKPEDIFSEVKSKVDNLKKSGERLDYISFVPDGEPTLDKNLGTELKLLKELNLKTAVITNASLLWMDDVKNDLLQADWVSLNVDAVHEDIWHRIDRPHGRLSLIKVLDGMIDFAEMYKGTLVTETMLVSGFNDGTRHLQDIAKHISKIHPQKSYLLVPTRPPVEKKIFRADSKKLIEAAGAINNTCGIDVECITKDDSEQGFFFTDNITEDLLNITSVHPIREDIINHYFEVMNADSAILNQLIAQNKIIQYDFEGKRFYKKILIFKKTICTLYIYVYLR